MIEQQTKRGDQKLQSIEHTETQILKEAQI